MAANKNIFVKIEVSSKKAEKNIKDVKKATDGLSSSVTILNKEQKKAAVAEQTAILRKKQQTEEIKRLAAANLQASQSTKQFKTQVGLNNAILTEAGRAASDLRFGFNGVANNVGQLASLFGSLINTSDSVATSMNNLFKSLIGTGGVMIAIQLLIAYGDRIYNFFTGMSESAVKAEKAMKKLEGTVQSQRRELLGYIEVLDDANVSEEVRINALKELSVVSKETVQDYEDGKISLDKLTASVELYIKQQRLRGQLEALLSSNKEVFDKREKIRGVEAKIADAKTLEEKREIMYENLSFLETIEAAAIRAARVINKEEGSFLDLFLEIKKDDIDNYDAAVASIIEIEKKLTANRQDPSDGGVESLSDNLTQFLDLSKKIQAARADIRKGTAIDDMDAIRIQGENEEAALEAQAKVFLDKQKQRLEQKLITQEQYNESEKQAEQELSDAILATQEKTINREINLQGKRNEKANQLNIDSFKIREELLLNEEIIGDENLGRIAGKRLKFTQDNLNQEIDGLRARLESEQLNVQQRAELQKQLSQAELKESNIRIKIADAEAQAKIESLNLVSSALSVASKIAGENSKAGKALAVSAALITTYTSANKAYLSQFQPIPTSSSPVRGALAAAVAVASGLMNVKKILSVNPEGQSNAGGGGGATVQAPNFNVVGASSTDQLAQAVGGQVNEPIRAFVVGSDVTNQQELDRRIVDTAGIG